MVHLTPEEQEILAQYVGWGGLASYAGLPRLQYFAERIIIWKYAKAAIFMKSSAR